MRKFFIFYFCLSLFSISFAMDSEDTSSAESEISWTSSPSLEESSQELSSTVDENPEGVCALTEARLRKSPRKASAPVGGSKKRVILVVDDESLPKVTLSIRFPALYGEGWEQFKLVFAFTVEEGLMQYKSQQPWLTLIDYNFPNKITGELFMKGVNEFNAGFNLDPGIFIAFSASDENNAKLMALGAQYSVKKLTEGPTKLVNLIKEILQKEDEIILPQEEVTVETSYLTFWLTTLKNLFNISW